MVDAVTRRRQRRELTSRLLVEYAGALPPGQVLATVTRTDLLFARTDDRTWSEDAEALRESIVRQALTQRLGEQLVRRP